MLLIDEGAEFKLAEKLKALRAEPDRTRCIYFTLKDSSPIPGMKEKIVESTRKHLTSVGTEVYVCEDGDICILAYEFFGKLGRELILDIVDFADRPASDEWVELFDLTEQISKLIVKVDKKVEICREAEKVELRRVEQHQTEQKRQAILSGGLQCKSEEIKHQRQNRSAPELMIIEDDPFSCRLVENVLQRKYSLTALNNTDDALDKYTQLAPNLLFLDINLPDVTGHELLEKIIKIDPDAYVIMLSGNADKENITQAMSKGAKGFVAKPFARDRLFHYIESCPTINQ
jgi:two-component system, chemotaxis family, chemotaxis protein CheY